MPTIAAGAPQVINLPANAQLIYGGGIGTITVGYPSGSARPTVEEPYDADGGTVGPFPTAVNVTLKALQATLYNIAPAINPLTHSPVYADQSGALYAGGSLVSGAGNVVAGLSATSATATLNTALIQAGLDLGGLVQIPSGLGDVYINGTLTIKSNTELVVGAGTRIRLTGGGKNMLVNTNWNATMKAVTSVTSADGKTATVVFPSAHGFAVGSYFFLIGCVPDAYNGVWPVKSVSTTSVANDTLTFTLSSHLGTEAPAITTPATVNAGYSTTTYMGTTSILASAADANITVRGGSWYWDIVANSAAVNYGNFGMYLRRIANLTLRDMFWESCRNPIVPANIYGGYYDNIACRNVGSLIQNSGSARGISIGTVRGDAWDDHTTFLIGDYPGYAEVTNGVMYGDMDEIVVDTVLGENAYRFIKLVGQANFKFGSVSIGKCTGRTPLGAAAAFTFQDDTGITTMVGVAGGAGTYCEALTIDEITSRDPCGARGISIQNGTINTLAIGKFNMPMSTVAGSVGLAVSDSATVNVCNIGDFVVSCASYSGNPYGILQDAAIGVINIGRLYAKNVGYAYIQGTNATTNTEINVNQFITVNCGQGLVTKKNGAWINIAYAERNGYQSSPWIQLDGNCDVNIPTGRGLTGTDAFGGSATSKNIRNCAGIAIDVGGTGVQRTAGAIAYYNSGSARGTLVVNNLVVCDATGAANSWKQISDTTKTY